MMTKTTAMMTVLGVQPTKDLNFNKDMNSSLASIGDGYFQIVTVSYFTYVFDDRMEVSNLLLFALLERDERVCVFALRARRFFKMKIFPFAPFGSLENF